jgi:hypothetical protein
VVDRATTGIEWGKGIQGQGMPWEDYLGTILPTGSRLQKKGTLSSPGLHLFQPKAEKGDRFILLRGAVK